MTNADRIRKAHEHAARSAGTLSIALGRNKLGRRPMSIVIADLREAADLLEGVLKS